MSDRRPFASDPATAAAFDRWLASLAEVGVEVTAPLRYLVGAVAAAETAFEEAHGARVAEKAPEARARALETERRLNASFLAAVARLEDAAEAAGQAEVSLPVAVGGGARILPMRRPAPASSGRRVAAVRGRIVAALRRSGPLTKAELRRRVRGDDQAFLRELKALQAEGEVRRSGRGVKGNSYQYEVI